MKVNKLLSFVIRDSVFLSYSLAKKNCWVRRRTMCHLFPHVSKCCYCLSLRSGAFVIGWVYLIISVFMFLTSYMLLIEAKSELQVELNCTAKCKFKQTEEEQYECKHPCYNKEMFKTDIQRYADIWYFVVLLALCVALLVGVAGDVPVLLLVFVYGIKVATLAYVAVAIRLFVLYELYIEFIILFVILCLIWWIPIIYCCIIVSSLYAQITKTDNDPTANGFAGQPYTVWALNRDKNANSNNLSKSKFSYNY